MYWWLFPPRNEQKMGRRIACVLALCREWRQLAQETRPCAFIGRGGVLEVVATRCLRAECFKFAAMYGPTQEGLRVQAHTRIHRHWSSCFVLLCASRRRAFVGLPILRASVATCLPFLLLAERPVCEDLLKNRRIGICTCSSEPRPARDTPHERSFTFDGTHDWARGAVGPKRRDEHGNITWRSPFGRSIPLHTECRVVHETAG